jgi:uncharacterized protein YhaN
VRLLSLALRPYGAYREETPISLDPSKRFHILYGLNESGKTTRRAAITDLLFGFEHRTDYDFAYEKNALRVRAVVDFDGEVHEIERRKGRSDTLRDSTGVPISDEKMRAWLGGISRESFLTRFSFGAKELEKGRELLLSAGGNVGYSLYGAALGGADARAVLAELGNEADALFKPRGQTMPINVALARYTHLNKHLRESLHLPEELHELEAKIERIVENLRELDGKQGLAQQRLARVEAIVSVIAEHEKYRELCRVIEEARARDRVPDEALDAVCIAVGEACALERREHAAREARERIDREPLVIDELVLGRALEIESIATELGVLEKNLEEVRGNRIEERARRNAERYRSLRDQYWPNLEDTALAEREPGRKVVAQARKLANEHAALIASHVAADHACEKELREQRRIDEAFAALPQVLDTLALDAAIEAARALGDIDESLTREEVGLRERRESLDKRVIALRFVEGGTASLAERKLPLSEQVANAAKREQELRNHETLLRDQRARACDALSAAETDVRRHEAAGELGMADRLKAARDDRDNVFMLVEGSWRSGKAYDEEPSQRFREAAGIADHIADDRYQRANAAARADRAAADCQTAKADLDHVNIELQAAAQARSEFENVWKTLWRTASIDPDMPAVMGEWLVQANTLLVEHFSLLENARGLSESRAKREERREALLVELRAVGHANAADVQRTVIALTVRGAEFSTRMRSERGRCEQMNAQRERTRNALETAVHTREEAYRELLNCRDRWREVLAVLSLSAETVPEAIDAVLEDLRDLFEAHKTYHNDRVMLEGVRQAEENFRQRATEIIGAVASDLRSMSAHALPEAIREVRARLDTARHNAARFAEREKEMRRVQAEFNDVEAELRAARGRRDGLISAAGVPLDGIEARITASLELRRLHVEEERLRRELRLGARCSVEEIGVEADRSGYDGLRSELLQLGDVLTTLVGARERLIEDRREVARAREVLDRSDEAAQAQGDVLAVGGEIDRHVRRYAALITAKTLLEEEVKRYSLTHQAPVLAAASRYLARLTGERYNQVRVVGDGVDQVIEAVCAQGERTVDQLSDGTRDQLYLALRLSVLEEHFRAAHALPLIVDDALLTFDDRRTAAALLAFWDFARLTQVIYFTHHERVLDIAREVLGADADLVRIDEAGVAV